MSQEEVTETGETKPEAKAEETVEISKEAHEALLKNAKELETLRERFLRSAADFENAKKRLTKERADFFKYALEDVVLSLLPILDNFDRALVHLDEEDDQSKALRDGFLLIQKQLIQLLSERGLKRIESIDQTFDPHVHESIADVEVEGKKDGVIVEEVMVGYELNGKLLRPAKVKVAKDAHGDRNE